MFEFLNAFGDQGMIVFFAVFIIFTILAYKMVKFLFKTFMIGLVAAMFPVVGSMVFGLGIEISLYNMIWFAVTGMGLFIAYSAIRFVWKFLKLGLSPFKLLRRRGGGKEAKEPKAAKAPNEAKE
jgi:hypothetical protein